MADETNDGNIRVQLSLLNAQDSAAAKQLADSLGEIAKMFQALKASDFRDTALKMGQLHAQMVEDTGRMQDRARDMQQRGSAPSQAFVDAKGNPIELPSEQQARVDTAKA